MRYGADHKAKTRQRVLKEAARALRAEGPQKVAVAEVMSAAGLTVGGFYAHFGSKDELVADSIDEMFAEARARQAALPPLPPAEALAREVDAYLSPRHRDARESGCPLSALVTDLPRLPVEARQRFAAGAAEIRARAAARMAAIGMPDPEAAASSYQAELVGALALARAEPDRAASNAILERSRTAIKSKLGLA